MTLAPSEIPGLLRELIALPEEQRVARVRRSSDMGALVLGLAEEVERLAIAENAPAIEAGELVQKLAELCCGAAEQTRAARAHGQALAYGGRFEEALACFERSMRIAEEGNLPLDAARARMSSMHALGSLGRLDDAVAAGHAARTALLAAGELGQAARVDSNLGWIHQLRDEPAQALQHFDRAREVMKDDSIACAQLDSNRAWALMSLNEFAAAERTYHAALTPFESADMHWAAAIVEGNLADLATRQGRLQRALYCFERARRHLERDAAVLELARLRREQAEVLLLMGLLDEACEAYNSALPELVKQGAILEVLRARAGLGRTLARLGRDAEAEEILSETAREFDVRGQPRERARLDLERAQLCTMRGDYAGARPLIESALETLAGRNAEIAAARQQLAAAALQAGDFAAAIAEVDTALRIADSLDLAPLRADLLYTRGLAHRAQGDAQAAIADLRAAVEQVERIRGTLQAERFRAAFHRNRLSLYEDLATTALDAPGAEGVGEAFATIERAKSRSLLDLVQRAVDLPDVLASRAVDAAERELATEMNDTRAELNAYYSRLADAAIGEGDAGQVAHLREEIRRREHAVESLEGRLATTSAAGGLYARPIDLGAAQRLVPSDAALIEYFSAGDELLAFVVRPGAARIFRRLARSADIAHLAHRLHFQIRRALRPGEADGPRTARLLDDVRSELHALYEAVFAPLRSALDGVGRLIFVPHGPLHTTPLHALWDGRQHLLEQYEISTAPSASMLAAAAVAPLQPGATSLVVGVTDEQAPQIRQEACQTAIALKAQRVLLNGDATVESVTSAMRAADIIHIAAHGHYSSENPAASGLRLSDRWLNVRDIYGMRLRCGLLTLSGCETGRTQVVAGDDLLGLVRGFLAAGAGAMVVSLWSVCDRSTADLMVEFYGALRGDARMSVAAALRAAQRSIMARRPHPAFWAPFILVGKS